MTRDLPPAAPIMVWKLVTRHDRGHAHKLLAVACVYNFIRKGWSCWIHAERVRPCDAWLLLHCALSVSALGFGVPVQGRLSLTYGYIYREVLLHTVLFSLRAITLIVVDELLLSRPQWSDWASKCVCILVVLPFHMGVDAVTRRYGTPGCTSIRGSHDSPVKLIPWRVWWLPGGPTIIDLIRRLLTAMQFINNHALCFGDAGGRQGVAFAWLAWSQINAFLMTLRKKSLLSELGLALCYTMLSVAVTLTCLFHTARPWTSLAVGATLTALRCGVIAGQPVGKYTLWSAALAFELLQAEAIIGK